MPPTMAQLVLVGLAVTLFAAGAVGTAARLWLSRPGHGLMVKVCMYGGLGSTLAVLVWHSINRRQWQPVEDNFDALIWLAALLTIFVLYMQRGKPIIGLEWFAMPIVILLLGGAILVGKLDYQPYKDIGIGRDTWTWVHRLSAFGGALAFLIAAAAGAMYTLASRALRHKQFGVWRLGSLERLDRLMTGWVVLGFALLTVGLITGFVRMAGSARGMPKAKLLLSMLAWGVYAVVLHAPINPRFRGRRAALLIVVGFTLVMATLVAVQFMPGGR